MLTYHDKDYTGRKIPHEWIGTRLTHRKRQITYIIVGFAWSGETDQWGFLHKQIGESDAALIWRPLNHLTKERYEIDKW